jgi:hypothetical protein
VGGICPKVPLARIQPGEYARADRDAREKRDTISREKGAQHTYEPRWLSALVDEKPLIDH